MEFCNRCKINEAEKKCNKCNKIYCKICDYYLNIIMKDDIHNNKLKKKDKSPTIEKEKYEEMISYDIHNNENKNNFNNKIKNNIKNNINFTNEIIKANNKDSNYLNSIIENKEVININDFEDNNLYNKESQIFLTKVNDIIVKNNELKELNSFNEINKNIDVNQKNRILYKENYNDIKSLQIIIEEQRKLVNDLKLENNKLKCILDKKELLIKKLNNDIDLLNNKFLSIQECLKKEIKNLNNRIKFEKEGI